MIEGIQIEKNEDVLGIIRRSFLVELPRFLFGVLWILMPFFFFFSLIFLGPSGWIFFFLLELGGLQYAIRRYRMWKKTMLIITTKRVIDVDQLSMKKRHIAELRYEEIDSVYISRTAVFGKLFSIGRIQVETSHVHAFDLEMTGVHNPEHVRELILDVQYLQNNSLMHDQA